MEVDFGPLQVYTMQQIQGVQTKAPKSAVVTAAEKPSSPSPTLRPLPIASCLHLLPFVYSFDNLHLKELQPFFLVPQAC